MKIERGKDDGRAMLRYGILRQHALFRPTSSTSSCTVRVCEVGMLAGISRCRVGQGLRLPMKKKMNVEERNQFERLKQLFSRLQQAPS